MKIAFVGKGGSGKSTVSWLYSNALARGGSKVMAIDADYNMDLAHNLGWSEAVATNYIHSAESDFYKYQGLSEKDMYVDITNKKNLKKFFLEPKDYFTRKYTLPTSNKNIDLMITGGVNEELLYGHRCSHAYVTSLKYYIPLLELSQDQEVVVDSVAGTDMVSYGMYLGVDAVVVVVEPHRNSIGVYKQIAQLCNEFGIPVYAVGNKVRNDADLSFMQNDIGDKLLESFDFDEALMDYDPETISDKAFLGAQKLHKTLHSLNFDASEQWLRHKTWKKKYDLQMEQKKSESFQFVK